MTMILLPLVFQINQTVMEAALSPDMLATDLAYYLVRKGVSSDQVYFHPNANCKNIFKKSLQRSLIQEKIKVSVCLSK